MSQQLVAKPQGVVSEPNKVGQFQPGAFARASNCAIRSFGSVEQVPKWSQEGTLSGGGVPVGGAYMLATRQLTVIVYEEDTISNWVVWYQWFNESTGSRTTGSMVVGAPFNSEISNDQRTGMLLMRNRLIVTGLNYTFAFDFIVNSSGSLVGANPARYCGVFQPGIYGRSFLTTAEADGGVLGPNKHMSACSVMRCVWADGYELVSAPSMLWDFSNLSTTLSQVPLFWSVDSNVLFTTSSQSFKIDLYRSRDQSVGYDAINNKYLPVATGSSFYLAKTVDRTGSITGLTDPTLPNALGESLLTNIVAGGAAAQPAVPVPSKTAAEFRGHAFYANRYDPATITLLNPYFWGVIPQTAPTQLATYGVGFRVFTAGAATNGSPTVTGLANTTGVVAGQNLIYTRTDTGAVVSTGQVVSKTGTTITSSVNSSYTGSVTATSEDVIEVLGTRRGVGASVSAFALNLELGGETISMDTTAVALEPQLSIPGAGIYPGFAATGGMRMRMRGKLSMTLRATNGDNYSPKLPEITSTVMTVIATAQTNGYAWSENNEPENCPAANYAFAGSGDIHKIIATRDCLWFFCSDGLFRLSGNGGSVADGYDWVLDPVDPRLIIHNPSCAVVHREFVYAYTNRGLVSISSEGVIRELSDGRINPSSSQTSGKLPNRTWTYGTNNAVDLFTVWMTVDSANDEVWLRTGSWESNPAQIWTYNTKTDAFCTLRPSVFVPAVIPTLGIYNQARQAVTSIFANVQYYFTSDNNTGGGNGRDFEEAAISLQPFYGGSETAAHTIKHWQDLQFSFKTPQTAASCILQVQGPGVTMATRTIPVVSSQPSSELARVGFTIPRNFPAMSNAMSFTFFIGATTVATAPVTLEAISVNFIDFTEQRPLR